MSKPKVGFYWCASCGGCEEAIVDLDEAILDVVAAVDVVFWPCAMDFKRSDVEAMKDNEMAVCFINGAVRSDEQLEMVELLRKKAGLVVAFGSCSHEGGIPGLANLYTKAGVLKAAYGNAFSTVNPEYTLPMAEFSFPEGKGTLPTLFETVKSLDQVIDVDYFLPGCPPPVKLIVNAVMAILKGELPEKGAVLAPDMAQCDECPRKDTKPEKLLLKQFYRPFQIQVDHEKCLLAQGLLCLGPVTRQGCNNSCMVGNMPCTGCMGPTSRVRDYGAKALSAIATSLDSNDDAEIVAVMDSIVDPAGTFYRYSLPTSLMHRANVTNGGK
ncbi:MAG: oxidoreductase [bacterium]|nr:oxidoreductase [bacterium]